jgi:hypothetical protein
MTQNPNNPQHHPDVPQWVTRIQEPPHTAQPAGPAASMGPTGSPGEQQWQAARQGGAVPGTPGSAPGVGSPRYAVPGNPGNPAPGAPGAANAVPAEATAARKGKAGDGRPSNLMLAGAGTLLAVLAFLGGTAVGHAWGSSGATDQTQLPGGGRFRQFPGQGQQPGQGTVPGQGNQQGQGTVPGQGTQPGTGTQQGQGTVPGQGGFRRGQGTVPGQGTDPNQVPQNTGGTTQNSGTSPGQSTGQLRTT